MSDMPTAYRMVKRVARKDHKCCECRGVIKRGETYNYHSGIWSGEPESYKVCVDCDALRSQYVMDCELMVDEVPAFGHLGDEVEHYHREVFMAIRAKRTSSAEVKS